MCDKITAEIAIQEQDTWACVRPTYVDIFVGFLGLHSFNGVQVQPAQDCGVLGSKIVRIFANWAIVYFRRFLKIVLVCM
jgi:hypothetical protein